MRVESRKLSGPGYRVKAPTKQFIVDWLVAAWTYIEGKPELVVRSLWDLQQARWERSLLIRIRKHSGMLVLETFGVELLGIVYLKSYPTIYGNNRMASRQIINLI